MIDWVPTASQSCASHSATNNRHVRPQSTLAYMRNKPRITSFIRQRVHTRLVFGMLLVVQPSILFAAPANPMKGGAFQCVTELINTAMPDQPRLKQLFYVAYSPDAPWMKIALFQNSEPDEKAERYTIQTARNGVISAINGNGLLAAFNTKSLTLRLGGNNPHMEGACDRLQ